MNLKFNVHNFRRRTLLLFVVVALSAAMLPTAAFASSYGHQGRAWDPGPRQPRGYHLPAQDDDDDRWENNNYGNHYNQKGYNKQGYKHSNQCDATYRIKRGDTLSEIASRYRVSVRQLADANNIRNSNRIYAGQVICIPC